MAKQKQSTKVNTTKEMQRRLLGKQCNLVHSNACSHCDTSADCADASAWRKSIVTRREKASGKLRENERSAKWASKRSFLNEQIAYDSDDDTEDETE